MRKTTAVAAALLTLGLTIATAPVANAAPTPSVTAPTEGAVVPNGFTGPVTVNFNSISEGTVHTFVLVCDDGSGPTQVDSRSVDPDGTSAPMSYSFAPIPGPTACVLTVRDPGGTSVLTRRFSVAGDPLTLTGTALSPSVFYPTVTDHYRDSATLSWTSSKEAGHTVTVRNSRGAVVRVADLGDLASGAHRWAWNGRSTGGKRLPVGTYRITVDGDDHAGSTATFARSVIIRSGYVVKSYRLSRQGNASSAATSGSCFVTRSSYEGTTSLDCWGGRYARASYTFRLPAAAYAVSYSLSGRRSVADICCEGRISRAGSRVSRTAYRVSATVTGWRAYDVNRVALSYRVNKRI